MSGYDTVRVERDEPITTVSVDRPEAMNPLNPTVLHELTDALEAAAADDEIRVIVLTGAGDDAFIAGADIKAFEGSDGVWFQGEMRTALRDVERAIEECPKVVIAAVNGVALGGGMEVAMMCDLVIAAESARFGQPEIDLGIIPGAGGTQRLSHLVGYLTAKEIVLTGRHVPATEAADIGLANEAVSDDEFEDRVAELAGELAAGPPIAQWFAKDAINQTRPTLEQGLRLEAALVGGLFETADKEEGVEAFIEKRAAEFSGE